MTVGAELESFGQAGAKADDTKVEEIFTKAGAKVQDLDEGDAGQVARHRPRDRLEGLRGQERQLRRAAQARRAGVMSHAFDAASAAAETHAVPEPRVPGLLGAIDRSVKAVNHVIMLLGGVALVCACLVLSYSVVIRYVLHEPTDWQDEMAVFLIVGATFFSAAAVQAKRGHVGDRGPDRLPLAAGEPRPPVDGGS